MAQLNVRIPDEMKEALQKRALEDERDVSFIVRKAISFYLEEMNKKIVEDKTKC